MRSTLRRRGTSRPTLPELVERQQVFGRWLPVHRPSVASRVLAPGTASNHARDAGLRRQPADCDLKQRKPSRAAKGFQTFDAIEQLVTDRCGLLAEARTRRDVPASAVAAA